MIEQSYKHRMGSASPRLEFPDGSPVPGREVTVRQVRHKTLFGCAEFGSVPLLNGELEGEAKALAEARLEAALELFNFITLPFYWGRFEPERGKPDTKRVHTAAAYLKERGCAVKGHPLCWHTVCAPWLLDMSVEEILEAQLARIRRDVTDFKDVIGMWDVINEVVIMPIFDKYDNGVTRICKRSGRIGLVKEVFAEARAANPGALLLINDFDMSESYDILLEGLLEAGVPIGAIGLQSHMHQGRWSDEKLDEVLERFSRFGLPLHFTEINLVSGRIMPKHIVDLNDYQVSEWPTEPEGEERQAEETVSFYKKLFAHPMVEAVTYWSFSDGGWLNAPTGFLTEDGRKKPVYGAIRRLIKDEWWSGERSYMTDQNGTLRVSGFKGDYIAEFDGGSVSFSIE